MPEVEIPEEVHSELVLIAEIQDLENESEAIKFLVKERKAGDSLLDPLCSIRGGRG